MEQVEIRRAIEALLFVFGEPMTHKRLLEILPDVDSARLRGLIQELNGEYTVSGRTFRIQEVAGGYQLVTDPQFAPWIRRALQTPKPDSVSTAALETLAIIAYRQPITKAEIEAIRGVDISASLETLTERRFVRVAGRKESPGRPFLYGTTIEFLRHFGLKSLEALPAMQLPTIKEPETPDQPAGTTPPTPSETAPETVVPHAQ